MLLDREGNAASKEAKRDNLLAASAPPSSVSGADGLRA